MRSNISHDQSNDKLSDTFISGLYTLIKVKVNWVNMDLEYQSSLCIIVNIRIG